KHEGSIFWIMEDDARMKYFYAKYLDKWIKEVEDKDPHWDIIYTFKSSIDFYDLMHLKNVTLETDKSDRYYDQPFTNHSVRSGPSVCTAGYLLSKRGIEKLLKLTEKIIYPIDVQIALKYKELNMYAFSPLITYCEKDEISDSAL
ncbi:MAG: glycosyltransferase family 25 protein, partial [Sedimenticola sp.]